MTTDFLKVQKEVYKLIDEGRADLKAVLIYLRSLENVPPVVLAHLQAIDERYSLMKTETDIIVDSAGDMKVVIARLNKQRDDAIRLRNEAVTLYNMRLEQEKENREQQDKEKGDKGKENKAG